MIQTEKMSPARKPVAPAPTAGQSFLAKFEEFERGRVRQSPDWLYPIRKAGIAHFAELGFPTVQNEEWRYTNIAPIAKLPFHPILERPASLPALKEIETLFIPGLKCSRMVFVDGHYAPELSAIADGIKACGLSEAWKTEARLLERHLGRYVHCEENAFVALNTAFFTDGAFIHIPANSQIEDPVHLLFVSRSSEPGSSSHPRNLVIAERGSRCRIIEHYASLPALSESKGSRSNGSDAPTLTNAVTEIVVGEDASVEHCKWQAESLSAFHIATLQVQQEGKSRVIQHSISTGAKIARIDIHLVLGGEGIESILNGLYLGGGDQLVDHHTVVDHAAPRCASHEFYNGILDGKSKGVFNGKIFVRKDAQKTDAKQTSRNLLLSDEATIDTKPQLEIFADDVKCTHGATVGQLNEEEIFYLRSRGIGAENARRMLIHAFASDVINRITLAPIREELEKLMSERLDREGV